MEQIQDIISTIFIGAGGIFIVIAALGILRLPDFYIRMSAITKAGTMGVGLIAVGIAVHFNDLGASARAFVLISFMLLTAPVAAHIIARAAYKQGVSFWKQNLVDELDDLIKLKEQLEQVVATDADNVQARLDLIDCYTSLPHDMGGNLKKAVLVANDVKAINPAEGHMALGRVFAFDGDFLQAEEELKAAIEISGGDPKFKEALEQVLREKAI